MEKLLPISWMFIGFTLILQACGGQVDPVDPLPPLTLRTPLDLEAIAENQEVRLTWSEVEGAKYYYIYYDDDKNNELDGNEAAEGESGFKVTTTSTTVSSLTNDKMYYFAVRAGSSEMGESELSSIVKATPKEDNSPLDEEGQDEGKKKIVQKTAKMEIAACIDGRSELKVQNGKLQITSEMGQRPGEHPNCGSLDYVEVRTTVDGQNLYAPQAFFSWNLGHSSRSEEVDIGLQGFLSDRGDQIISGSLSVLDSNSLSFWSTNGLSAICSGFFPAIRYRSVAVERAETIVFSNEDCSGAFNFRVMFEYTYLAEEDE